jgi:hypothetical protein
MRSTGPLPASAAPSAVMFGERLPADVASPRNNAVRGRSDHLTLASMPRACWTPALSRWREPTRREVLVGGRVIVGCSGMLGATPLTAKPQHAYNERGRAVPGQRETKVSRNDAAWRPRCPLHPIAPDCQAEDEVPGHGNRSQGGCQHPHKPTSRRPKARGPTCDRQPQHNQDDGHGERDGATLTFVAWKLHVYRSLTRLPLALTGGTDWRTCCAPATGVTGRTGRSCALSGIG